MSDVIAVVLFFGITAYALFGGADFGAGFWDLIAGGAERGKQARNVVDHSIGPVWEANHVWLIFVLVVLWTSFSEAFGSIMLTLFVPLSLAALGIVLRGSSFAFRKEVYRTSSRRNFGAAFAISSVMVPFFMGTVAGAIASGRVPEGGVAGDTWDSWVNPTSILGGVLAVTVCAFLAAVYMVWDAKRFEDDEMVEYFRVRAIAAAVVTGVVALVGIWVLYDDARYVFDGLMSRALAFVIISGICGVGAIVLLVRNAHRGARCLRHRCGDVGGGRLGRGPVAVHAAQDPHGLGGRRTRPDAVDGPGRVPDRGRRDPAVARPAVLPRPAQHAGGRRGAGALRLTHANTSC